MTEARAVRAGAVVIGVAPLLVPAWAAAGGALAVAALVGLSLVPTAGWLRRPTLVHGAAAGLGAHLTALLLAHGQSVLVAFVWAVAVGAFAGLAVSTLLRAGPQAASASAVGHKSGPQAASAVGHKSGPHLPHAALIAVASLALSVLSWTVLQARVVPMSFPSPLFLGIDLGAPRARYVLLAGMVLMGGLLLERLRVRATGRGMVATGADPGFAARTGTDPITALVTALCLSGGIAGVAGWGAAVAAPGLSVAGDFTPALTVAYLAIPLIGGTASSFGVVLGAALLVVPSRVLGIDPLVVGGILLALAVLRR